MLRNYFILRRFVKENRIIFRNSKLLSVYSQEKDRAILVFSDRSGKFFYTEISANPANAFITIRSEIRRAKKNTIDLFTDYLPASIEDLAIAESDRVLRLKADRFYLYFAIRGKFTNLHLISSEGDIHSFKRPAEENPETLIREFSEMNFTSAVAIPEFEIPGDRDIDNFLKTNLPVTGKEIRMELKRRSVGNKISFTNLLKEILYEIIEQQISVFYNSDSGEIKLAPSTFSLIDYSDKKEFSSISEAINFYLHKSRYLEKTLKKKIVIRKYLDKELNRLASKINSLRERINRGDKEEEYNRIGSLILINLHLIKPAMEEIELENTFTGDKIKIKLDKKISPQKNAELYFNKAKSERNGLLKSSELLNQITDRYNLLSKIRTEVENNPEADLDFLMKQLNLKTEKMNSRNEDLKTSFRKYIIEGKYRIFVGKDSRSNDLLTTKFARQNDYWFHARGTSGSHVVLYVENVKEGVPKNVLRKAASIAAFHSKAKTAGLVPVAYTLKKYVVKKKGDPAGTVRLLREKVLLVKPEIPSGCEFVPND